ncbi:MAG: aKG-HExxH-type peptide beta-hydroxylase [Bauldia sp.]
MDKTLFDPDAGRARALDASLRAGLSRSLEYLAGMTGGRDAAFDDVLARLAAGPVSPFVFGSYAALVAALSRDERPAPHRALLAMAARMPAAAPPVVLGGGGVPPALWPQLAMLFDTDADRPFRVQPAAPAAAAAAMAEIETALDLLRRHDPAFCDDVLATQRLIVLAEPVRGATSFGAASTFFLWGLSILNAQPRRDVAAMLDVLVHESGHLLLFGLAGGEALAENGAERHQSPLRRDPRPIEGIFHAAFVATRVHAAFARLLAASGLDAEIAAAVARGREASGTAGRSGLATLTAHAVLTARGREIIAALDDYWGHQPGA